MAITFPINPQHGQQFAPLGIPITWQFDSGRDAWRVARGAPAWVDIVGKPTEFPPSAHEHPISDVTGLQNILDVKQDISARGQANGYPSLDSTGKVPENQLPFGVGGGDWNSITGKPSEFPPSPHTHPVAQISDSGSTGQQLVRAPTAADARTIIGAIGVDDNARVTVKKNDAIIGVRRAFNLHEGSNVTMAVVDDPAAEEVDITINAAGGGGGSGLTVSDVKPAAPFANDMWLDTTTGLQFIYYNDGNTSQWIESIPYLDVMPAVFTKFDFPPAPINDQLYNPIPGVTWKWSATRGVWFAVSPSSGSASYTKTEADAKFVDLVGDTMTGPLTVVHPPTANGHASSKQYVDTQDALRVAKTGDTMSGLLTLSADPTTALQAATKQYADSRTAYTPAGNIAANTMQGAIAELDTEKVAKAGDTMTGNLTINPPTGSANVAINATQAATQAVLNLSQSGVTKWQVGKQTNDDYIIYSVQAAKTGLTVSGTTALATVTGDPTVALGVATKQYVDARVAKTGDTMTGDLAIAKADPVVVLQKNANNQVCSIFARRDAVTRWQLSVANNTVETGSNNGSDFAIYRYDDSGVYLDSPFQITRSTGNVFLSSSINVPNQINLGPTAALTMYNGAANLFSDPNQTVFTKNTGGTYDSYSKANGYNNWVVGAATSMQLQWSPVNLVLYGGAYKPAGGPWLDSSDSRIKNVQGDFTTGLDAVATLRPVTYTFKGNDTPEEPSHIAASDGTKSEEALTVPYPNSPHYREAQEQKVFHGLVAQEVETVFPEMVTKRNGYIDGVAVNDLRDLDTGPLIFALINAIKELKARIEVLEAT